MGLFVKVLQWITAIGSICIASFCGAWLILDYRKQERVVKWNRYRNEYSKLDLSKYCSELPVFKGKNWVVQKNAGPDPVLFHEKIELSDHSDGIGLIVQK